MGRLRNNKKHEIVFDNKKREEFLKGFSKRKKQRQRKAQEEIEIKLKEEKKRLKEEAKNLKEKFKHSFKQIDDVKNISSEEEDDSTNDFETDDVRVTVKPIKTEKEWNKKFIGSYRGANDNDDIENSKSEAEVESDENDSNEIPGMEISDTAKKSADIKEHNRIAKLQENIKSEKDFKKMIKKQTKSALKKSKVIQKKNSLNHKRNVKSSHRKKYFKEKFLKKHKKIPKHNK